MDTKRHVLLLLLFVFSLNANLMGKKPETIYASGCSVYIDERPVFTVHTQHSFILTEGKNAISICRKVEFLPEDGMNLYRCDEREALNVCGYNATPIFTIEMPKGEQYMVCALSIDIFETNENLSRNPYFLVAVADTILLYKEKNEEDKANSDDLLIVPTKDEKVMRGKCYLANILCYRAAQPIIIKEIECMK